MSDDDKKERDLIAEAQKYLDKTEDEKKLERFEIVFNTIVLDYIDCYGRSPDIIRIGREAWACLTRIKKSKKLNHAGIPIVLDSDIHDAKATCGELH